MHSENCFFFVLQLALTIYKCLRYPFLLFAIFQRQIIKMLQVREIVEAIFYRDKNTLENALSYYFERFFNHFKLKACFHFEKHFIAFL